MWILFYSQDLTINFNIMGNEWGGRVTSPYTPTPTPRNVDVSQWAAQSQDELASCRYTVEMSRVSVETSQQLDPRGSRPAVENETLARRFFGARHLICDTFCDWFQLFADCRTAIFFNWEVLWRREHSQPYCSVYRLPRPVLRLW